MYYTLVEDRDHLVPIGHSNGENIWIKAKCIPQKNLLNLLFVFINH